MPYICSRETLLLGLSHPAEGDKLMDVKRRKFLKIAGVSAIAGIGAPAAFNSMLKGDVHASSDAGHGKVESKEASHGDGNDKPIGKQYGLVIDPKKFHEDKGLVEKCVTACHKEHNVPQFGNPKDEIKWIWKESYEHAFPEHSHHKKNDLLHELPFMVVCNHCENPPCVKACPTKATFKNEDGVVMMDYHRCIGCRFCMAACPYGARSFNWRSPREKFANGNYKFYPHGVNPEFPTRMRGVVEKCNLCAKRINGGKQPACVEACGGSKAIVFGDVNDPKSEITAILKEKFTIQRKPSSGTKPSVFYII
jgi:Fe-S-cluster-containing dehydrogenase component